MALITRISRLFRADLHAVLDNIEEPELLLRQSIREMEDELAVSEKRLGNVVREQEILGARREDLDASLATTDEELDLCLKSGKDDLARNLIRRKLEAGRLVRALQSRQEENERFLSEQRQRLDENRTTLEALRQKAELVAERRPGTAVGNPGDGAFGQHDLHVSDDEVEVALLREKDRRNAS